MTDDFESLEALLPHAAWRAFRPAAPADARPDVAGVDVVLERFFQQIVADVGSGPRVLVAVNDADRPTRTADLLAQAVAARARVAPGVGFDLLVGGGSHILPDCDGRARHEAAALGEARAAVGRVDWHGGDTSPRDLVAVGPAVEGLAPRYHRALAGARAVLALGSVEPHYFAGLTGAHKTATIGALATDAISRNHRHALEDAARPLALDGNPVFDGIAALVRGLLADGRRLLTVNQVLCGGFEVARAAGGWRETLAALRPACEEAFTCAVARPADVVIARVEGPLATSLYQADKGFHNAAPGVADGGVLVVEAACEKGLGADRFVRTLRRATTLDAALRLLESEGYRLGDHKAVRLRRLGGRGVRLAVVSPNLADLVGRGAVEPVPGVAVAASRDAALRTAGIDPATFRGKALFLADAGHAVARLAPPD